MGILIKNVMIITMDNENEVIDRGYILIKDNKFSEVSLGEYTRDVSYLKVIDGKGYCALPGLINSHTHAAMTILRGYGEGLPLMRWLNEKIWPMEHIFKPENIKLATEFASIEMMRTGTTCFNNMYFFEEENIESLSKIGIRAVLGSTIMGEDWRNQIDHAIDIHGKIKENNNELITSMIAPHSPYTLNEQALRVTANVAKSLKSGIHIHVAETEEEIKIIKEKYNRTPCELLEETGIFENRVAAAHCVYLTDKDMDLISKRQIYPIYNPQSNMKLASGVARVSEMFYKNIGVCLGTDGTSSNNNLNMFEEMETGAFLQKLWYKDATKLDAKDVIKMATVNGAKALGINNLGKIKEGYLADLILINLNKPSLIPINDICSNVVFSANGSEVEYVIINGNIIMKKGQFVNIDEEKILYNFKSMCENIK